MKHVADLGYCLFTFCSLYCTTVISGLVSSLWGTNLVNFVKILCAITAGYVVIELGLFAVIRQLPWMFRRLCKYNKGPTISERIQHCNRKKRIRDIWLEHFFSMRGEEVSHQTTNGKERKCRKSVPYFTYQSAKVDPKTYRHLPVWNPPQYSLPLVRPISHYHPQPLICFKPKHK
jgi:hypothetical protein